MDKDTGNPITVDGKEITQKRLSRRRLHPAASS
jgi:hypothetical protein